jgi:predicted permease
MLQDIRYAFRNLRRTPVFTAIALTSLALGIGANSAVFTIADQVLVRDLPGAHTSELLALTSPTADSRFSYPMFQDFRDRSTVLSAVAARYPVPLNLTYNNRTERIQGELVSGTWFDTLGLSTSLGRPLTPDDDRVAGGHSVVVLTHDFWRRRFSSDRSIVNKLVLLNGHPMTVVGVAEPRYRGFDLGLRTDVLVPTMMKAAMTPAWNGLDDRRIAWLQLVGRLRPGISVGEAEARLQPFYRALLQLEAGNRRQLVTEDAPLTLDPAPQGISELRTELAEPVRILVGIAALLLVLACANVANLLLARAAGRRREMAIRLAVGAGRNRLIRQLVAESITLAAVSGALALLVGTWTVAGVMDLLSASASSGLSGAVDLRVIVFTFTLAALAGAAFGIVPAWRASDPELAGILRQKAGNDSPSFHLGRRGGERSLGTAFVISQVAIALVLAVAAGLFTRSYRNLSRADLGFRRENLAAFSADPSLNSYSPSRIRHFADDLRQRLSSLPGVRSVAAASHSLVTGGLDARAIRIEGFRPPAGMDMNPDVEAVGPAFFATLGIPLAAGREFTDADRAGTPRVAVVNQAFARAYFHGDAAGRRFQFAGDAAPVEIVGVARDTRQPGRNESSARLIFLPLAQILNPSSLVFFVHTASDPRALYPAIRREAAQLDASLPLTGMRTMASQVNTALSPQRLIATLAAIFAALATILAAIGVYGLVGFTMTRRTREIGIRVALGAHHESVLRLVMRQVAVLTGAGLAVAAPITVALVQSVRGQLYGVAPYDPISLAAAAAGLAVVLLAAGYIPALWASRANPSASLRE